MKELMKNLSSLEEFETYYKQEKTTIFVFSANWCPDCRFIEPFLPELMEEFNDYDFIYVDRDEWVDLAQGLRVLGIPSFVAVREGVEVDRFVSKLRKTKAEIHGFLAGVRA
ncbi:MAG: thioredoxin family protein [Erysipelotrichaceae bacterium]